MQIKNDVMKIKLGKRKYKGEYNNEAETAYDLFINNNINLEQFHQLMISRGFKCKIKQ